MDFHGAEGRLYDPDRRRERARVAAVAVGSLLLALPTEAAAPGPRVVVGDTAGSGGTGQLLGLLLAQEIDRSLPDVPRGGPVRFELTGNVTQFVRIPDATRVVLSCEVSLVLVERPGGSVRALLRGRSHLNRDRKRAVEAGGDQADVEEALRIAVRGALRPLRTAVGLAR